MLNVMSNESRPKRAAFFWVMFRDATPATKYMLCKNLECPQTWSIFVLFEREHTV